MQKEIEILAEKAHKRREKILKLKRVGVIAWLELGKELYEAKESEDWKYLGFDYRDEPFKNWGDYCLAPEVSGGLDLSRNWITQFKEIYRVHCKELCRSTDKLLLVGPAKLYTLNRLYNEEKIKKEDKKEWDNWYEKAENLSIWDLREEIKELFPPPKLETIKGKYNVFVIDPPWPYGTEYDEETRRVASPYEEQPIEKIREWGIKEFPKSSHPKSVIWLWTTHQFMKDARQLMEDWGFNYKLTFVWDKQKIGMGEWLRCQVEFCLLGIKGDYHKHWNLTNERDILSIPRQEHSRKPKEFYEMVKKLCPGNRIDIFSREKHEGFEQYGNETNKF